MFYPFIKLMETERFVPGEELDVEPVIFQFEIYVRLVTGIAYDKCRKLLEEPLGAGERELLDKALRIQKEGPGREVSQETYRMCVSKYCEELREWCETNRQNPAIINFLPEADERRLNANCILNNRRTTISLGEYYNNLLLLTDTIRRLCPGDIILDFLEGAIVPVKIYQEMRNKHGHNLTPRHRSTLRVLRKWLEDRRDPVFSRDSEQASCEVIVPQRWDGRAAGVPCGILRDKELDSGSIPVDFLRRQDLVIEPGRPSDEFENALFIRMANQGVGKQQYFRVSPFIAVKRGARIPTDAEYGMLLRNTPGGEYQYRGIRVTNCEENSHEVFQEGMSAEETLKFEQDYCFFASSIKETVPSKMQPIGEKAQLYISRHPQFRTAIRPDQPFPYYPVIDKTGNERIEKLQKKQSGISFIFLIGHGGLGKTYLVLNLLRTKYNSLYSPRGNDLAFDQIMFLSAKQSSMQTTVGNIEMNLDHDIHDYESMICVMAENLLNGKTKKCCGGDLAKMEEELLRNGNRQFVIIDDLDTMKFEEQIKVCRFFDRFKNENHRVLITSRVVSGALSSLVSQQTTIMLHPLDSAGSLQFCRNYMRGRGMRDREVPASEIENIQRVTCGIPLNLVLVLHLMEQGHSSSSMYSQAEVLIEKSTNFIFQHVINALEETTKRTFGMLSRFGKALDSEDNMNAVGADTLRLFVPSLSDDEYDRAIFELENYAVIARSEDRKIYLRSAVFLEGSDEIVLNMDSQSVLGYINQEPEKWQRAIGDMGILLNYLLEIAKGWKDSGDTLEREWAGKCAAIVLRRPYEAYLSSLNRIEWNNLLTGPGLNMMDELRERVEKLQQHNPKTEQAVMLMKDRCFRVLETLDRCKRRWNTNKGQISRAFDACADVMEGLCDNSSPDAKPAVGEVEERLKKCYWDFEAHAGECVSARCEEVLE